MSDRFFVVASLWIHEGRAAEFEAYERKAVRVMQRYGGAIERAIRVAPASSAADEPFEIHVVSFPERAMFDAYRADSELHQLSAERAKAIARTSIALGHRVRLTRRFESRARTE